MRLSGFALLAALGGLIFCAGCNTAIGISSQPSPPPTSTAPLSLTLRDTPPAGVTVLRFAIQVTGASLLPQTGATPTSLIATPIDAELTRLQASSALLASLSIPAVSFSGLQVTFANPELTIWNGTGTTLTAGGVSCASGDVCQLTPTLNQASATIASPLAPFPLTVSTNVAVTLQLDFDVEASLGNDLSVTPTVSLTERAAAAGAAPLSGIVGTVTAVNSSGASFTLQPGLAAGAAELTIETGTTTLYAFPACAKGDFSCLVVGEIVRVDASLGNDGSIGAAAIVELAPAGSVAAGTVVSVNDAANQFEMAVTDLAGAANGVEAGVPATVSVAPQATFEVDAGGLTVPGGLSFTSLGEMTPGQRVAVAVTGTSTTSGVVTLNASDVRLEPSQVTGTLQTLNAGGNNFVLENSPALFATGGAATILVQASTTTVYEGVSGLGGLATGDTVSAGGLVFRTVTGPQLVAAVVRLRN
jgi:hypothetical protein